MIVTGYATPFSSKIWVMPIFFPISPFNILGFLLAKEFVETVSLGLGCIISGQCSKRIGGTGRVFSTVPDNTVLALSKLESREILPSLLSSNDYHIRF
jgi:hypothetical protein